MENLEKAQKIWKAVKAEMEVNLSSAIYKMWIEKTQVIDAVEGRIQIGCVHNHMKTKLNSLYGPMIRESLKKISKGEFDVEFVVREKTVHSDSFEEPLFRDIPVTQATAKSSDSFIQRAKRSGLNPSYTFDKYIMGNTNRLAYAIATSISENPGKMHNPFFLYAGVGLGKTHLVQAIGNAILAKNPDANVIYCTGERFTNELIDALQNKRASGSGSDSFRKKYRSADILLIDDIQFIAGKDTTQEEFFHTFNDLYMNRKQIVLASDRPPEEFKNLEDRITSRFKSGIMADIQQPDFELRTAVLRSKRDSERHDISNEILDFIAEKVDSNIRELEGAYIQVLTYAQSSGEDITVDTVKRALSNIIVDAFDRQINFNDILKAVCNYYAITKSDIKGQRRQKTVALPRQVAMYLMYDLLKMPLLSIGEVLGGRDHTTIIHGIRKIENELRESAQVKAEIINIKKTL